MNLNPFVYLTAFLGVLLVVAAVRIRLRGTLFDFDREATLPLRALLALFVVLGHLDNETGHSVAWFNVLHWSTPAVAVFFFLSGYGLWKSLARDVAKGRVAQHWRSFPVTALTRIFVPVLLLTAVWWGYKACVGQPPHVGFLRRLRNGSYLLLFHDWFVWALVFFYVAFGVAFRFLRERAAFAFLVLSFCAYYGAVRFGLHWKWYWFLTCGAFPLGALFARFEPRLRDIARRRPVTCGVSLALALTATWWIYAAGRFPVVGRIREPFYVLLGPSLAFVFWGLKGLGRVPGLRFLGTISYEIFLVHGLFQVAFRNQGWSIPVYCVAVCAATLVVSVPLAAFDTMLLRTVKARMSGGVSTARDGLDVFWVRFFHSLGTGTFGAKVRRHLFLRGAVQALLALVYGHRAIARRKVVCATFSGTYGCNPKYIARALAAHHPDVDVVWLLNEVEYRRLGGRVETGRAVPMWTLRAFREIATARVWVDNAQTFLLTGMPAKRRGQFYLDTWHGSLGIKRLNTASEAIRQRAARMTAVDAVLSNSDFDDEVFRTSYFPKTAKPRTGHPRNDVFFWPPEARQATRARVRAALGVSDDVHLALYAPTFRERTFAVALGQLDFDAWAQALAARFGGVWRVVVRLHPHDAKAMFDGLFSLPASVLDASSYDDMQELLLAVEAGVTDYSSWIFDFLLGGAPGFIYAPDKADYDASRGFYYPLEETPFPVAVDEAGLLANMRAFDAEAYARKTGVFLKARGCMEDGHAAERAAQLIVDVLEKETT